MSRAAAILLVAASLAGAPAGAGADTGATDLDLGPVEPMPECIARARAVLLEFAPSRTRVNDWGAVAGFAGGQSAQIMCLPVRSVLRVSGGEIGARKDLAARISKTWKMSYEPLLPTK